jgi:hypothetical protein
MSGNDVNKDIRLKVSFFSHLKTKRLRRELGCEGIISLIKLWMYAAVNKPTGDLTGMSAEDIAIASDWEGDPDEYQKALVSLGFLDEQEGMLAIHDWEEHNPWAANAHMRSRIAKENAERRWRSRCRQSLDTGRSDASGMQTAYNPHADSMPAACKAYAPSPIPSPSPLPSPNPCIDSHSHKDAVNDRHNGGDRRRSAGAEKKGKSSIPDEQWLTEIRKKYDWIDLDRELKKAEAWCITNKKQLTRKRFINWLNRANSEKPVTAGRFLDD